ncbi:hypothetical protein LEMA_P025480.1 [Plenodomus lingam JN3]|uniref:Vezatin n=1 Tax=Leptosphaeria maculans (strain JN3 / isolate v23.1.3 / race Av1-4-5-6-7-8) TaxID=985895 RepID=E4ZXI6_LEPMJ|nr:hypothetical protein LEMA_P025480.1 [Plenodomus lingam JN3]CBX95396.1 hypothetical protein LEMA_P025480.1 [Plenodomus lingam JN3]
MENVIPDDSPLAEFLEGKGRGGSRPSSPTLSHSSDSPSFAPRGPSTLQTRIRDKLPQPLRIHERHGSIARIHTACSKAVNSRLGRADNERFLEHFRYLVVASQLLGEQGSLRTSSIPSFAAHGRAGPQEFKAATISPAGAALTGSTAFILVWLVHWSRRQARFSKGRATLVVMAFAVVATAVYTYMRRQWLQYLRQEAVEGASALVTNLQAFEASTSSALALIQEVELVSRGYRLCPLPPISRMEERGQSRRCQRLRRNLQAAFAEVIPILAEQCGILKQLIQEDDLEKYLDVYEISNPDLQEAAQGYSASEFDDAETLKALRTLQYRLSTLRRVYLCSLLALEADGGKPDFSRWSSVVESMLSLARPVGQWSEKFNRVLSEEEQFILPSPNKIAPTPGREKIRNSVRKLSGLSQGIRGLQAKMQVLREETNRSLEDTEDVTELGHHLMAQYDSIGADLKSLMQAWEVGKNALALNIDRQERRISLASSSGLRSPVPSLGGLTAVDEGSPSDALRALNGGLLSPQQSAPSSDQGSTSDDEIFEAIAIPKTRATMSREERMQKIQDDRVRQASLREQRESNTNMLRELESVINLRPHRATGHGARVTSL